jgi:hypothetical protein
MENLFQNEIFIVRFNCLHCDGRIKRLGCVSCLIIYLTLAIRSTFLDRRKVKNSLAQNKEMSLNEKFKLIIAYEKLNSDQKNQFIMEKYDEIKKLKLKKDASMDKFMIKKYVDNDYIFNVTNFKTNIISTFIEIKN